jgi:hypothetical protein
MTQSLGVVNVTWAGVKFPAEKGASFKQGGLVNKAVMAGSQIFRSQEPMPSMVSCTTPFLASTSIAAILGTSEGELQFLCDTGQTYTITDAFIVEQIELTGGEGGKLKLTWNGSAAEEILP